MTSYPLLIHFCKHYYNQIVDQNIYESPTEKKKLKYDKLFIKTAQNLCIAAYLNGVKGVKRSDRVYKMICGELRGFKRFIELLDAAKG